MSDKNALAEIAAYSMLQPLPEGWSKVLHPKVVAALISGDGQDRNESADLDLAALESGDQDGLNESAALELIRAACDEYSALPGEGKFTGAMYEATRKSPRPALGLNDSLLEINLETARGEADLDRAIEELANYKAA